MSMSKNFDFDLGEMAGNGARAPRRPSLDVGDAVERVPTWLVWVCGFCETKLGARVGHYDLARCDRCGRFWWALRPGRGEGLRMFVWPGRVAAEGGGQMSEIG